VALLPPVLGRAGRVCGAILSRAASTFGVSPGAQLELAGSSGGW